MKIKYDTTTMLNQTQCTEPVSFPVAGSVLFPQEVYRIEQVYQQIWRDVIDQLTGHL
jgi:hypothetical protein